MISGGTALVIMLKIDSSLLQPCSAFVICRNFEVFVMSRERVENGGQVTIVKLNMSSLVREKISLAQTFGRVGTRVRNAATVGGNLSEADYASIRCVLVALALVAKSVRGNGRFPWRIFSKISMRPLWLRMRF